MAFTTLQILGYMAEGVGFAAGILMALLVLRKDPSFVGNKLMALSSALIGTYMGCIFLYDIIGTALAIQILLRVALIAILFGTLSLFYTMQVMVHSSKWLDSRKNFVPLIVVLTVISTTIVLVDFIKIIEISENVNTQIDLPILLMIIIAIVILLLASITNLYIHGIKKVPQGELRNRMITFFSGLVINLMAIGITIAANLVANQNIGAILDVLFFSSLALGIIVMAIGFGRKS